MGRSNEFNIGQYDHEPHKNPWSEKLGDPKDAKETNPGGGYPHTVPYEGPKDNDYNKRQTQWGPDELKKPLPPKKWEVQPTPYPKPNKDYGHKSQWNPDPNKNHKPTKEGWQNKGKKNNGK